MSSIRMDNTEGKREVHCSLGSKELLDFYGTGKPFQIYLHLFEHIIRKDIDTGTVFEIYKDYYCEGKLAARLSQKRIAKYLGLTERTVRRSIKILMDKGYIKKVTKRVGTKTCNLYLFGIHEDKKEKLFLDDKVYEESLTKELSQFQGELG